MNIFDAVISCVLSVASFHEHCDGKGPTVILVYAKNCKFGGFLTSSWGKAQQWYEGNAQDYLFWLEPSFKLHCKDGAQYGHHDGPGIAPNLGGGHDLYLCDGCLSNESSFARAGHTYGVGEPDKCRYFKDLGDFSVQEYEVFSVQ